MWKNSINNFLYQAHSHEINIVYDYLIEKHETFKDNCLYTKKVLVKEIYKDIFDELKKCLLEGKKDDFYTIVEQNLIKFDNDIFTLIEELINPLMYEVGYMWQHNKLSVAKEHLATNLTHEIVDKFFLKEVKQDIKNL